MYESIVVIIRGVKYILTYNTNAMVPEDLADIIDLDEDIESWNDSLMEQYDSEISEYEERLIG